MSIIFGKYHIKKQFLAKTDLIKMHEALNYWDADDSGLWKNEYIGLGHLMLWNTPESLYEKLPLKSRSSGNIITADARIDNRDELFLKLKITDKNIPDSTLILATYDKYGHNCVKHLLGDFAFVIWDVNKEQLFCARDHMGVKPFYYYYDNNVFIWASNLRGIKCLLQKVELNNDYINTAICLKKNDIAETCFSNIKKLKAANILTLSSNIVIKQYWDIKKKRKFRFKSENEYREYLQLILKKSIICRSRTAFSLGCQLSGGLDSSAIVSIAFDLWKKDKKKFHTFTHSLPNQYKEKVFPFIDESKAAKTTIEYKQIKNSHFTKDANSNYLNVINEKIHKLGGLFPLSTEEMTLEICSIARENNIRTMMSGFLGDSGITFRANNYLLEMLILGKWKSLRNSIKQEKKPLITLSKLPFKLLKIYFSPFKKMKDEEYFFIKKEYQSDALKAKLNSNPFPSTIFSRERQLQLLTNSNIDNRFLLENEIGRREKLQTVYPLADKRIIEFSLALPVELKVKNNIKRYIFKEAVKENITNDVYNITKNGIITLPVLHQTFLNSFSELMYFIEQNESKNMFKHVNFEKIKKLMIETKNIKDKKQKRHALIACHFILSYILYVNQSIDNHHY